MRIRQITSAAKPDFATLDPAKPDYEKRQHDAYLYFNEILDNRDLKIEALKYLKGSHSELKSLPDYKFLSIGKLCWIMNNGGKLDQKSHDYLKEKLKILSVEAITNTGIEPEPIVDMAEKKDVVTIQDHMSEKLGGLVAELENVLDQEDYGFDSYAWMKAKEIAKIHAERIVEYYAPLLIELDLALGKNPDSQIREAYQKADNKSLQQFQGCVAGIIKNAEAYIGMKKISRKPHKKKVIPASKLIKNLNYQKEDNTLKIGSIDPTSIIGASDLWTYNTKYRILIHYVTESPNGFSVKGSTLLNWSAKESEAKRLRKPEITLKSVREGGKIILRKIMSELTTKPVDFTGRINKDTLLIRVIK